MKYIILILLILFVKHINMDNTVICNVNSLEYTPCISDVKFKGKSYDGIRYNIIAMEQDVNLDCRVLCSGIGGKCYFGFYNIFDSPNGIFRWGNNTGFPTVTCFSLGKKATIKMSWLQIIVNSCC